MQSLVEILSHPFPKMLIWIPKFKNVALSILHRDSACCAGLEIVENMHKDDIVYKVVGAFRSCPQARQK